ncbi:MAG TPA: DivIVA domain-containing protein [Acidimicrobiia bacterium]
MADGDLPRRTVSSSTRLSPEEIVNRGFASAFRGLSETEVRNFLRRIADDLTATRDHERELAGRVEELEARLRNRPAPTEQELLDALGEETARVLRSAQEAAEDIRRKAEERSTLLLREAQDEVRRLRETTEAECSQLRRDVETEVAARKSEVETAVAELRTATEREVEARRDRATRDAEAAVEAAKHEGREMVAEARAVRERVLTELGRRRSTLQAQIDELRNGRERLLEAYRTVKRTLAEATDALSHVEAPPVAPAADTAPPPEAAEVVEVVDVVEVTEVVDVVEVVDARVEASDDPAELEADAGHAAGAGDDGPGAPEADAGREHDVDALFAKLRAGREDAVQHARAVLDSEPAGADAPEPSNGHAEAAAGKTAEAEAKAEGDAADVVEPTPTSGSGSAADAALVRERDAALKRVHRDLVRAAKRAVQDEQNELLDVLRQQRGRPAPEAVLPGLDDQLIAWTAVVRPALDTAYAAAGRAVTGTQHDGAAPGELVDDVVRTLVLPLRERVYDAVATSGSEATGAADEDATQRINARYREWKTDLDAAIGDLLTAAWGRGTLDAAPAGAKLRWVPEHEGRCPDCDDNALEPTTRGEAFPTGQAHPPAHPGCRCILAVDVDAAVGVGGGLEASRS